MTVFIVDDDEAVRQALMWLFRSRKIDAQNFPSAESFLHFKKSPAYGDCLPAVLLVDVRMEGMSGLQLFEQLRESGELKALPVIFLTGHAEVSMAVEAVQLGAFDFFEKPFSDNRLVDRVALALEQAAREQKDSVLVQDLGRRLATLTEREQEVMNLIRAGRLNKVIADELDISMRTVEVHRSRIFEKLGVRSAVEMVNLLAPRSGKS